MAGNILKRLQHSEPIDIEFKDVSYIVKEGLSKEKKLILKGVSGNFRSGELTAIMGPSGAGKSSLLNILTGFQTTGALGTVHCSGVEQTKNRRKSFRKDSSYIMQEDVLPALFTVEEMLGLATDLKLGHPVDKAANLRIEDILDILGLEPVRNTTCNKLSGGQRKHLSIGIELVTSPPVMFLDEPTTGLDISMSLQCVSALKSLAKAGHTIICTIHQPSYTLLELFDHVYVLSDGLCVYQGTAGNILPFLQTLGLNCPPYHNPADFMIEVASGDYGQFIPALTVATREDRWRTPSETENQMICKTESKEILKFDEPEVKSKIKSPSEFTRFWILVNRNFIQMHRDWKLTHVKIFGHLLVGITLGALFQGSGWDASKTFSNLGCLFCTLVYLSYTTMMPAILRFPLEMSILKREYFNNWYCLKTYYLAMCLANTPVQISMTLLPVTITYFMTMQPNEVLRYLMFTTTYTLMTLVSESIGLFLGTMFNTINGTFCGAIMLAFFVLLAGYIALFNHMPVFMYWLTYTNYLRFAFEGLILSVYGYDRGKLACPEDTVYCHMRDPKTLLKEFSVEGHEYWVCMAVLFAFLVVIRYLVYLSLCRTIKNS